VSWLWWVACRTAVSVLSVALFGAGTVGLMILAEGEGNGSFDFVWVLVVPLVLSPFWAYATGALAGRLAPTPQYAWAWAITLGVVCGVLAPLALALVDAVGLPLGGLVTVWSVGSVLAGMGDAFHGSRTAADEIAAERP
jgi:hypothetical protein